MRADAHYVDQLESAASGPAIRMVSTRQIDCASPAGVEGLDALTQSIAAHGLVQPLIVRRQNGRYKLIAGRKRLTAAIAAGLNAVPCLLHDLEENAAAWIAEADNLRAGDTAAPARQPAGPEPFEQLIDLLANDLSTITTATLLLNRAGGYAQQVAADLIQAQAWRASWLVSSARRQHTVGRPVSVAAIVARVCTGFQPQARITGLQLETAVAPTTSTWTLYEEPAVVALTGCVFATLSWLDGHDAPRIEIRADANARTLQIEVTQRLATVPREMERYLRDSSPAERGSDAIAARALQSARSVAALQDGTVELTVGTRLSTIRISLTRPNAN